MRVAKRLDFEVLLEAAGRGEVKEAEKRLASLMKQRAQLQRELDQVKADIRKAQAEIAKPVRAAIRAARELGVEVPEDYQNPRVGNGVRRGRFYWEAKGLVPKQEEVSRAMWRLSKDSGGSAGRDGQGILTVAEFWSLVKEQTGKTQDELELGEKVLVELPNGREVTFQKVEE